MNSKYPVIKVKLKLTLLTYELIIEALANQKDINIQGFGNRWKIYKEM